MQTIAKSHLDTDTVDEDDRPTAYLLAIDRTLETEFLTEALHARIETCYLGPLRVIECIASPRRSVRTAARILHDRHDAISLQLAVSGTVSGDAAGRRVVSGPGTVMVLDFGQPFSMIDQDERTIINVAIPRVLLARHIDDLRAVHGLVLDVEASAILAAHLIALTPRLTRTPVHAAPVLGDIIIQLFLIALGYDPVAAPSLPADRRTALIERARQIVDGRLGSDDLTPEWLMAKLNVSRSELYQALDDFGGVARFIWRRRIEAAKTALADRHDLRRIGAIAFAFGFSSEAHFARAFRLACGKTASEFRREHA